MNDTDMTKKKKYFQTKLEWPAVTIESIMIIWAFMVVMLFGGLMFLTPIDNEEQCSHGGLCVIPLVARDAEDTPIDDTMFYLRHTGGEPLNLSEFIIEIEHLDEPFKIDLEEDVVMGPPMSGSTWDETNRTISVNQRVYFSPSWFRGRILEGDEITVSLYCGVCGKLVFKDNATLFN